MTNRVAITGIGSLRPEAADESLIFRVREDMLKSSAGFREWRRMDRFCKMGFTAFEQTMRDRGSLDYDSCDIGIFIGTVWGTVNSVKEFTSVVESQGPSMLSPNMFPLTVSNCLGGYISIYKGFTGPNITFTSGCSASADAIGFAWKLISDGIVKAAIVGGVEEYSEERHYCHRKSKDNYPIGEGAAFIILENMQTAQEKSTRIYGEVLGYASRCGKDGDLRALTGLKDRLKLDGSKLRIYQGDKACWRKSTGDLEGANAVFDITDTIHQYPGECAAYIYTDSSKSTVLVYKGGE